MDLKNNKIELDHIMRNPKGKTIMARNFPELMNPFLLKMASKMSLENTLKLARGPYAKDQINRIITDLEAI